MGIYLNSRTAYTLYKSETEKPYFVDKSRMLEELFPLVKTGNNHICITRPRRFGKTVMANMIASFFSKAYDAQDIFQGLQIANIVDYEKYRNQFSVIHISFNELGGRCTSYAQYIERIEKRLMKDLKKEYPEADIDEEESAAEILLELYAENDTAQFVFVLDEWDFIFHQSFITENDKREYLMFLRNLLKDRPYVLLAYMTGILPIAKYSSGSELNMFSEFTLATEERFSEYFGFTEEEVFYVRAHGPLPSHWERIREPLSLQCSLYCRSFIHFINSSIFINMNRDVVRNDVFGSPVLLRKKGR